MVKTVRGVALPVPKTFRRWSGMQAFAPLTDQTGPAKNAGPDFFGDRDRPARPTCQTGPGRSPKNSRPHFRRVRNFSATETDLPDPPAKPAPDGRRKNPDPQKTGVRNFSATRASAEVPCMTGKLQFWWWLKMRGGVKCALEMLELPECHAVVFSYFPKM